MSPTLLTISSLLYTCEEHNSMMLPIQITSVMNRNSSESKLRLTPPYFLRNLPEQLRHCSRPFQTHSRTPLPKAYVSPYTSPHIPGLHIIIMTFAILTPTKYPQTFLRFPSELWTFSYSTRSLLPFHFWLCIVLLLTTPVWSSSLYSIEVRLNSV